MLEDHVVGSGKHRTKERSGTFDGRFAVYPAEFVKMGSALLLYFLGHFVAAGGGGELWAH